MSQKNKKNHKVMKNERMKIESVKY